MSLVHSDQEMVRALVRDRRRHFARAFPLRISIRGASIHGGFFSATGDHDVADRPHRLGRHGYREVSLQALGYGLFVRLGVPDGSPLNEPSYFPLVLPDGDR